MENQDLPSRLNELKYAAFKGEIPNISVLNEIKRELFRVEKNDREKLKGFIEDLKHKLFETNTRIRGLDLDNYFIKNRLSNEVDAKVDENIKVQVHKETLEITFDDLFRKMLECIQDTLFNLKGYAILKLSNNDTKDFTIKVLYDENYYFNPIESRISKTFNECDSSSIREYEKHLEGGNRPDTNLLCLVLLTSKINNEEGLLNTKTSLTNIFHSFDNFEFCSLKSIGDYKGEFYKRGVDKDDFFEELRFTTTKFLSNGKISFEEEKIVKKVFSSSSAPVLTYKLLKAGNSGAKVIEIKQIKPFTSEQYERRYIVKFCRKDDKRKLKFESQRFTDFIESYDGFDEYNCTYCESAGHEALLYRFAKSGNASNSYPFAEALDNEDNIFYETTQDLLGKLFGLQLLSHWEGSLKRKEILLKELYKDYVNLEKIGKEVLKIQNITVKS